MRRNPSRARRRFAAVLGVVLWLAPLSLYASRGAERGFRDAALDPCDEFWDRGRRHEARRCYSELISSKRGPAVAAEAYWALGQVKRANEMFREAVQAEPEDPDLRVRWGYLYLQTHQEGEALNLFNEALKIDKEHIRAKLGTANVFAERFEGKARKLVEEVLKAEPEQVEARLLLARMALEEGELDKAEEVLDAARAQAEKAGRPPLAIYSLRASLDLLRGTTESEWTAKALRYNPAYGEVYAQTAHFYLITRRYREAVELLRKAVETDPELWEAHAALGVNLLRENHDEEGKAHLEIAYNGDPFSAQTVNSLRLLDSFENFRLYSSRDEGLLHGEEAARAALEEPEVILRLHKKEAALLKPYVMDLARRGMAEFSKKYGFTPDRPVYVEFYPDHDDFAVRTLGMPGIGLLGVTFGYLVAMDSPSARKPGGFHWGTTLWHELAHVFTLEKTNHLVPRWFSEGLSMYEEWEAAPSWGERISPDFIDAFKKKKLLPVAELDKGFIRPSYPNQIAVSYFQAGLVCRFIDREWGFDKLVAMLENFSSKISTADNIERTLGLSSERFDERFDKFLQARLGKLADGLKSWREALKQALTAARKQDWEGLVEPARKAKQLYPEYVEAGSPYVLLAEMHEKQGDRAAAVDELLQYLQRGGRSPETIKKLAAWLEEAGRRSEAIEALEALLYIWPADQDLHADLGDSLLAEGRTREAAREFEALIALDPIDKAGAHYRLASAYHKMSDSKRTRRHLLTALEAAPGFRPAQKLLLEIARLKQ